MQLPTDATASMGVSIFIRYGVCFTMLLKVRYLLETSSIDAADMRSFPMGPHVHYQRTVAFKRSPGGTIDQNADIAKPSYASV